MNDSPTFEREMLRPLVRDPQGRDSSRPPTASFRNRICEMMHLVLHFIVTLTFRARAGGHGMPCPKFPIVHLASKSKYT